jgi:hypothetical protein
MSIQQGRILEKQEHIEKIEDMKLVRAMNELSEEIRK